MSGQHAGGGQQANPAARSQAAAARRAGQRPADGQAHGAPLTSTRELGDRSSSTYLQPSGRAVISRRWMGLFTKMEATLPHPYTHPHTTTAAPCPLTASPSSPPQTRTAPPAASRRQRCAA